jgi:multiple sugar transport system permease protein
MARETHVADSNTTSRAVARRNIKNAGVAYLFVLPTVFYLIFFSLGAMVAAVFFSFLEYDVLSPPRWAGLDNFQRLFASPLFPKAVWNTIYFAILYVPAHTILSLLLALLVNRDLKGVVAFRTAYFLPVVSSVVAISLLWTMMYGKEFGLINYGLKTVFGVSGPGWLSDPAWAMPAVSIMSVWKGLGVGMMIFLAGLQDIPKDLYDSAQIDGSGAWRRFLHITLPLVSPTTFFVAVVSTINSLQVFSQIYVMTEGGPRWSTTTLGYFVFVSAFEDFRMGYASAVGVVLFVIVMFFTLIQFRLRKSWVHY